MHWYNTDKKKNIDIINVLIGSADRFPKWLIDFFSWTVWGVNGLTNGAFTDQNQFCQLFNLLYESLVWHF